MENFNSLTIISPKLSLVDLLGYPYIRSVCEAKAFLENEDQNKLLAIAEEKADFYPLDLQRRLDGLLEYVGERVATPLANTTPGAGTNSFTQATTLAASPLSALGFIRIGEDGKAHLTSKSEHYHASLGHAFPGYRLIENAKRLGIPNATHNNTRGYITRRLEEELVCAVNGLDTKDRQGLQSVLDSREPHVLNRVINLETGSLAVEAAVKMMLARFYQPEETDALPPYNGRIPVFLVMADWAGGKKANYHGTTIFTQFMRGLWPGLHERLESSRIFEVRPVKINDLNHFQQALNQYDRQPYKVAGFIHEIVLMNYGGILLHEDFLQNAYTLCNEHDVPTMVDEIQSCVWVPGIFMFREYGLDPDFVAIGKGFPGGEYAASRIITTCPMDNLSQFGALVTNGQEELASLSYLVTLKFLQSNRDYVQSVGEYYQGELDLLAKRYPHLIQAIEGSRHLSTLFFHQADAALKFIHYLNQNGIDISAQTYKAECPPAALTKIPVISSFKMVDFLIEKMDEALKSLHQ